VHFEDGIPYIVIPYQCPELMPLHGCLIYEDRPLVCKQYDGRKDLIMKGVCKWEELEDEKSDN